MLASAVMLVLAQELTPAGSPWTSSGRDNSPDDDGSSIPLPDFDGHFDGHVGLHMAAGAGALAPHGGAAFAPLVHDSTFTSLGAKWRSDPEAALITWWLPRLGVLCMALCSAVAPVLPLALVPTVSVGTRVGKAYGQLDMLTAAGQALGALSVGWARQTGGFGLALRTILLGILFSLPTTLYAQRAMRSAISAMHTIESRHALIAEVAESPLSLASLSMMSASRIRPHARLFAVHEGVSPKM